MVFPSVPAYLDPPNWNTQQQQQGQAPRANVGGGGGGDAPPHHLAVGQGAASAPEVGGRPSSSSAAGTGSAAAQPQPQVRPPNSMTERARVARVPQPEPALKCPRCDSTNTKFCYYNNYSLSQPRHFCKTCRRYWTRGGSLRSVPVGGGCRRNKRSSKSSSSSAAAAASSSSKPSSSAAARQLPGGQSTAPSTAGNTGAIIPSGLSSMSHQYLPFLGQMHQPGPNLGLAFSAGFQHHGMQQHGVDAADQFPVASGGGATLGTSLEQWRVQQQPQQQFPFMGGLLEFPPPPPMYQLGLDSARAGTGAQTSAAASFTLGQNSAMARNEGSTKLEEDSKGQEMSLQRQYMAALRQGEGFWGQGGNGGGGGGGDGGGNNGSGSWTMNIPGFHSSSTGGGGSDGGGMM